MQMLMINTKMGLVSILEVRALLFSFGYSLMSFHALLFHSRVGGNPGNDETGSLPWQG
jgi:hypothetical protein